MSDASVCVPENLVEALDHLAADGLVAFPTETVWGLAARANSQRAVDRLRSFKDRALDQPISVLIDGTPSAFPRIRCCWRLPRPSGRVRSHWSSRDRQTPSWRKELRDRPGPSDFAAAIIHWQSCWFAKRSAGASVH